MKTIYIRNVDESVVAKIDALAAQKHLSRNKLVNIILESYALSDRIKETENNYSELVNIMAAAIENNTTILKRLEAEIKEIKK